MQEDLDMIVDYVKDNSDYHSEEDDARIDNLGYWHSEEWECHVGDARLKVYEFLLNKVTGPGTVEENKYRSLTVWSGQTEILTATKELGGYKKVSAEDPGDKDLYEEHDEDPWENANEVGIYHTKGLIAQHKEQEYEGPSLADRVSEN